MPKESRPAMPFYCRDFFADGNVQRLDNDCVGFYLRLLCECWQDLRIEDNAERVARFFRVDSADFASRCWPQLRPLFEPAEPGMLLHAKVEKIRADLDEYSARMTERGRSGARARWDKNKPSHSLSGPKKAKSSETNGQADMPKQCLSNDLPYVSIDQASDKHMLNACLDDAKRWPAFASSSASVKQDISVPDATASIAARFKEFWELYPAARRCAESLCWGTYESLIKTLAKHNDLMDGLKGWLESEQWTRSLREDGGSYIPYADKFIEKQRYLERPPKKQKSSLERAAERAKALDIQK